MAAIKGVGMIPQIPIAYIKPDIDYTLCRLCNNLLEYCGCPVSEVHPIIREDKGIFTKWTFSLKMYLFTHFIDRR